MGFFKDVNDGFMQGLWKLPRAPLFGVMVKKGASPVDPRRLSRSYKTVRNQLALLHESLIRVWAEDNDVTVSHAFGRYVSAVALMEFDVYRPKELLLHEPIITMVEGIASTDPRFQPLEAPDITHIPVDEHFALSEKLAVLERFIIDGKNTFEACARHMDEFVLGTLHQLPESVALAPVDADLSLSTLLVDALEEPHQSLAMMLRHFMGFDAGPLRDHGLLESFREEMLQSVLKASNLKLEDLEKKEFDTPLNHLDTPASELAVRFLGKSPLTTFLHTPVPYEH